MLTGVPWLLSLDVGRLDNGPPFVDFGFLERCKRLRRLPDSRGNLLPHVSKPKMIAED